MTPPSKPQERLPGLQKALGKASKKGSKKNEIPGFEGLEDADLEAQIEASTGPFQPPPKDTNFGGKSFEKAGKNLEQRSLGPLPMGITPRQLAGATIGGAAAPLLAAGGAVGLPLALGAGAIEGIGGGIAMGGTDGGLGDTLLNGAMGMLPPLLGKAGVGSSIVSNDAKIGRAAMQPPPRPQGPSAPSADLPTSSAPMAPPPRLPPQRPVTPGVGKVEEPSIAEYLPDLKDNFDSYIAENALQPPAGRRVAEAGFANGRPKTVTSNADMERWAQWASDPASAQGAGLANPPSLLDDFAMGKPPVTQQPPLGNPRLSSPDLNYLPKQGSPETQMPPNFNNFPGAFKTEAQKAGGLNALLTPPARFPEGVARGGTPSAGKNVQSPRFPTQTTDDDLLRHTEWLKAEDALGKLGTPPPPRAPTSSMRAPAPMAPPPRPVNPPPEFSSVSMTRPGTNAGGSPGVQPSPIVTPPQSVAPSSSVPQSTPAPDAVAQFEQLLLDSRTDPRARATLGLLAVALGLGGAATVGEVRGRANTAPNVPLTPPPPGGQPFATQRPRAPEAMIR